MHDSAIVPAPTESLLFLIASISYEPKTVLLHLEDLKQELLDAAATYKAAVSHPKKALLLSINVPSRSSPSTFELIIPTPSQP